MSGRRAAVSAARSRRFAWGLAGLAAALGIGGYVVRLVLEARFAVAIVAAIAIAFAIVGALVASRHPRNAIGWMFVGVALSAGLGDVVHAVVEYRLATGGAQGTLVGAAAAYAAISWVPFVLVPATFVLLLFPDGKLPSRRWRYVAWCAGVGIAGAFAGGITSAGPNEDFPTVSNPLAIDSPVMEPLEGLSFLLILIAILGCTASIVVRFRHAQRVQRQQIKWLAVAGALLAVIFPTMLVLYDVVGENVANVAIMLPVLALPICAGIAILRHRLYDIDVVINRALVYGALTATLAGAYLASVLLLQLLLSEVTAGSGLAVAPSTLAVAALFRPARSRIQAIVDRRFYRRKYDAVLTLNAFSGRLRDEVDLDALGDELRSVVAQTMQPARVSLWLRDRQAPR